MFPFLLFQGCSEKTEKYLFGQPAKSVVLNWGKIAIFHPVGNLGHLTMSGDIFDCYNWRECCWHLVDRGQGCSKTSCNTQGSPLNKEFSSPECQLCWCILHICKQIHVSVYTNVCMKVCVSLYIQTNGRILYNLLCLAFFAPTS